MQEHVYEHFCDNDSGFLNDVSITFIDKTDPTNPLQRENYWKHTFAFANICSIRPKHERKCVAVSLLILISFT